MIEDKIQSLKNRFLNRNLDFRVRLFNILAIAASIMNVFTSLIAFINGEHIAAVLICFIAFLFSVFMLIYSQKTGNFKICYLITIITVFFIIFPIVFFNGGGYKGAMPFYFIFAVIFTVLMLDKSTAIIVSACEMILYISICVYAYMYPSSVTNLPNEFAVLTDKITGVLIVSIVCGIVLFLHLKEYELQRQLLAKQNKQLQQYNEAKSTFLTTVAHEVKNPLTAISVNAHDTMELIEESPQDKALIKKNLQTIGRVVIRIDRILVDLMDTVSIEQGRLTLSITPIHLEDILREGATTLSTDIKAKNNKIIWDIDELPLVYADYERLLQVIINLLSNSIKHTRDGSITLSLKGDKDYQEVTVTDTGSGISEKIKKDVFKGYVSMSDEYWRHGIGLFISHQIVSAHGGEIKINSEISKGTSISFKIPVKEK